MLSYNRKLVVKYMDLMSTMPVWGETAYMVEYPPAVELYKNIIDFEKKAFGAVNEEAENLIKTLDMVAADKYDGDFKKESEYMEKMLEKLMGVFAILTIWTEEKSH